MEFEPRSGREGTAVERRTSPATSSLAPVLPLCLRDGLPLHVVRRVCAAARERNDVVDDPTLAAMWVTRLPHELRLCFLRPLDATLRVTRYGDSGLDRALAAGLRCLSVSRCFL